MILCKTEDEALKDSEEATGSRRFATEASLSVLAILPGEEADGRTGDSDLTGLVIYYHMACDTHDWH